MQQLPIAMYSASVVDNKMEFCFLLIQDSEDLMYFFFSFLSISDTSYLVYWSCGRFDIHCTYIWFIYIDVCSFTYLLKLGLHQ